MGEKKISKFALSFTSKYFNMKLFYLYMRTEVM